MTAPVRLQMREHHVEGDRRRTPPEWWSDWRGELLMVAVACSFVLVAFPTVALGNRSFSTGWRALGVNGFNAPPNSIDVPQDEIRLDPGASAWQFEPWAEVTNQEWRKGHVPLWNPYQGMGTPHAGNFQSAVFDPLLTAVNLHPTPLVWDLTFLGTLFLGAAAMYLFLRDCGLGRLAALVGTGTFMLSGYFFLSSNNQFFRSYLYLPALLLLARRTVNSCHWLPAIALGLAVAGNLLLGMPETSVFVLGTLALYSVFLLSVPEVPIRRWPALGRLVAAAGFGGLLAAPLLLPAAEFTRLAYSTHERGGGIGQIAAQPREMLAWLAPFALGKPIHGLHGIMFSGTHDWIGMAAAVAVCGALAAPTPLRRHGGWFFAVLGAAILAKSYGFSGLSWVGHLPILDRSNFVNFALPVVGFCAAALVGIAVQSLLDDDVQRTRFIALSGVLLGALLVLVRLNRSILADASAGHLRHNFGILGVGGAAVFIAFLLRRRRGCVLIAVVVIGELAVLAPRGFQQERADAFVKPAWLRYVMDHALPSHDRVFATDGKLFPNVAGAFSLEDIRSLDALYLDRYVAYIKSFIQPTFRSKFVGGPFASEEPGAGEIAENPMFDLAGVRYVITAGAAPGPTGQYREVAASDGAHVYENTHRIPRALVLHEGRGVRSADEALNVLQSLSRKEPSGAWRVTDLDPRRQAVVEGLEPGDVAGLQGCPTPGTAAIRAYTPSKVLLSVDSACPGLVVLTDMYYPGWQAKVNGHAAPIRPVDVAFRGVFVPEGRSVVEFNYAPRSFRAGVFFALLAVVSAAAVVVWCTRQNRRSRSGRSHDTPGRGISCAP